MFLCFFDNRWIKCPNVKWIKDWSPRYLQPIDIRFVRESMYNAWDGEWQYGVDGEELAISLEIGDNFVINVEEGNNKGKDSASSHFTH
jgi:hypothetical protein